MDLNQISGETSIKLYWILLGNPFMHPHCLLYHFLQQLLQTLSPTSPTLQDQTCHLILAWKGFAQLSVCLPFTYSLESLVKSFLHKYSPPPLSFHSQFI